ncbi:unnamed protein product, partial [Ectocarpus sp. 12 AP-2014]
TYTFEEARVVSSLYLYFTNVTEDMSVIVYTLDSSTDGDEEFVAQIIETVTGSAYYPIVGGEIYLQPTPFVTAVKIEADLPAGDWFSILEAARWTGIASTSDTNSSRAGPITTGFELGSFIPETF